MIGGINLKKILSLILVALLSLSLIIGCSNKESELDKIKIGVSPDPHGKLVQVVVDDLKKEGIDVEIIEFTDYVTPNLALAEGELDANYFQHLPYLNDFISKENLDLIELGSVHIEPMALYSNNLNSIDDIKDGGEIAIPNDTVNGGRALLLLEANNIIKLKEDAGLDATENDIIGNPKNIKFVPLEAAYIPRALSDVDAAVINGNYALESGLNPVEDSLLIEGTDSPYANIVAVRAGEEKDEKYIKLIQALQSNKIKDYMKENYDGAVVPAF